MYATPSELIDIFRMKMNDTKAPYFWTEKELFSYMTEGEQEIARLLLCLQDTSSVATSALVDADQPTVLLNQAIVRIRDIWWLEGGGEYKLDIESQDAMVAQGARIHTQKGRPEVAMTGSATNSVRLYPIPQNAGELVLSVYRTPLNPLNAQAQFEIPKQYRGALLDWMQRCAYLKDDAETYDRAKSTDFEQSFGRLVDGYMTTESQRRGGPQSGGVRYGGL